MAVAYILEPPNSDGQNSTVFAISGPTTFMANGTFDGAIIKGQCRKTSGEDTDWKPIPGLQLIDAPGPINVNLYGCDVRFTVDGVGSSTSISIEDDG